MTGVREPLEGVAACTWIMKAGRSSLKRDGAVAKRRWLGDNLLLLLLLLLIRVSHVIISLGLAEVDLFLLVWKPGSFFFTINKNTFLPKQPSRADPLGGGQQKSIFGPSIFGHCCPVLFCTHVHFIDFLLHRERERERENYSSVVWLPDKLWVSSVVSVLSGGCWLTFSIAHWLTNRPKLAQ